MTTRSQAQVIEVFHLLFLRVLTMNNAEWCTLKGGANLRYFFGSLRYSNDIDLDFVDRRSWGIARSVDSLLTGNALALLTRTASIEIEEFSAPKQTDTTLRWKVGLRSPEYHGLIRTKIEFSGRDNHGTDIVVDAVPDAIVRPYALQAPTIRHYGETAAINQKIAALALRSETKARDIFDLDHLFRRRRATQPALMGLDPVHAKAAAQRAMEVPFASFTSEVTPFLDADLVALYSEATWDTMCVSLAEHLGELATHDVDGGERS